LALVAAWAWWALLAGCLVFNKPFATIGFPPLYVGEMVLCLALVAHAWRLKAVFLDPLRSSHAFAFIAVFLVYGLARALLDYFAHGLDALRDSVIAGYAICAFLGPALWRELAGGAAAPASSRALVRHVVRGLLPVSLAAALWAAAHFIGLIYAEPWTGPKTDLLAVSAAIAAWVWLTAAGRWFSCQSTGAARRASLAALVVALASFVLVVALGVRAVWVALAVLPLALVAALAFALRRRVILAVVLLGLCITTAPHLIAAPLALFERVDKEYSLGAGLDGSRHLEALPETAVPGMPGKPGGLPHPPSVAAERLQSIFSGDESQFTTAQGRFAAGTVKWRAIFWVRCCRYAFYHAPVFGIGFGRNLTELLRDTKAWPLFIPSMELKPPNRSPHSAHVTIFTRLGFAGLALWLCILASVGWGTLRALWRVAGQASPDERAQWWDGLALLGVWLIWLCAMSFGVVLEGPMGGIWFWALTGVLASWSAVACDTTQGQPA
jgi:hypothetical protein